MDGQYISAKKDEAAIFML